MTVKLRIALQEFVRVIVEEAERNPTVARRVENSLGIGEWTPTKSDHKPKGGGNRRTPAVLDPIDAARQGEEVLRQRLAGLSVEQLKDIVADYGMDPGKLVMKWKTPARIIDRIVEFALARAVKGDVFLK
jgi:hypothetical protein